MIVHSYELFRMNSDESISSLFTRFTKIVNSLKSLGKFYTNCELVRKFLRYLPKNWKAKVTAFKEAKKFSTLGLDELLGFLMTYEISMKGHEDVENKKKSGIVFKASSNEEEHENSSDDESYAMFSRNLKKQFKKNNYGERRPFKKEYNKDNKKEPIISYECKNSVHMKMDLPKLKNLGKDYKRNKKAMVTAWGESEDESSSDEIENEVAN